MIAANGFAQGVIDVHSHIITPEFVSSLENEGRLMDEGFPLPKYDVENHLKWMDEAGVQTSVLTLAAPQPSSAEVIRQANETAARIKKEHPGRFLFCAALPLTGGRAYSRSVVETSSDSARPIATLSDVSKAIEEAKYALDVLKADGIKLATNVNGQYLGAPELDTLFSVLNERKAVVILHPHRPEPVNKQVMQQTPLAMQEYLSETTRAVSNMISRNVLARYNNIKVVVPHCGAYLPLAIPRMKSLTPVMQANKMVGEIDYEANLRALYYDLAGAHSPGGQPPCPLLRPRWCTLSRGHPHATHHHNARPSALRFRLSLRRSTGTQAEFGEDEGLSLKRARPRTIQGDDTMEECPMFIGADNRNTECKT